MKLLIISIITFLSLPAAAQTMNSLHPKTFKMPAAPTDKDSITVKQYYFVMLTDGPKRAQITDTFLINKLQDGHMANISRLTREGKLLVSGPFGDGTNWRGIFIFDCDTQEEVEQLLATDPAIKAGRLGYQIHPWWTAMNSVFR